MKQNPALSAAIIDMKYLSAFIVLCLIYSGTYTEDRLTWFLEIMPIIIALPVIWLTAQKFPLTPITYRWIFIHMIVLIVGGYYTYAKVPLGFWMQDWFGFERNNYDRIGHFMQGFVPALIAREILLRKTPLQSGKMVFFLTLCVCLAISAAYELFEWLSALLLNQSADAFLGTQGDPWDTQTDMAMALVGALCSLVIMPRFQDRHIQQLKKN